MSFCGSRDGSLSVRHGVLKNKCFVDVLNIIPHGVMIVISVVIILVWRKSILGQLKAKTWVHFKCHTLRWIITLVLTFVSALEIVEGFVSDFIDPDSVNYHILIPPCISFISTVLSLVLYHNIEMWNSPRFLLMLGLYWISSCGLKLLKAFALYQSEIETIHLRLWICWLQVALYASLVIIELVVLVLQRYACYKKFRKVHPAPGLEKTRYYAMYANFLSQVTFSWMQEILVEGFKSPLTLEQLGALPQEEKTVTNYKKFLHAFEVEKQKAEKKNQQPSLHRIYLRAFWPSILIGGICRLFGDLLAFIGPWCIESIVNFAYSALHSNGTVTSPPVTAPNASVYVPQISSNVTVDLTGASAPHKEYFVTVADFLNNGYALCAVLFMSTLLQHTLLQNHHYFVIRQGIRLRSAVQAMVYSKALRLSSLVLTSGKMTIGQIINHMSMDATFLMMHLFFIHYIWATPLQVVICICLMYLKLGLSAVLGGLLIVLSAPIQVVVGRSMSIMQKKCMQHADARVKKCNEMVQGIKVIKLLAWETFIARGISESRKQELKAVMMNAIFKSLFTFIGTAAPILATFLTFVLYPYIENKPLTAGKALSTLALFNIMAVPLVLFSLMTSTLIMANISAKRLVPFFLAQEVEGMQGFMDTIKTEANESIHGDEPEASGVPLLPMGGKDKFDAVNASMCSLNSHVSPRHSRQNSSSSLLDFASEHHVNPAVSLSVGNDHHHQRRRHHSGVSIEELQYDDLPYALEIADGSFSWDLDKRVPTLKNIQLKIPYGKLVMVVGSVGSGKSSLVCAMLGEMLTVSGKVTWCKNSNIALVTQKPWLLNKTLKDNILFGSTYSWKRYQKVIECCALQPDIDSLPAGDGSEIGEKGVNLSGGQKQRVCIARALYSTADIIIMDDPFSALDAQVGRHVFDEVVLKKLLQRKKTVILVTHQLQYLNYAHSVVVMNEGEIECQGKLSELKRLYPEIYNNWRKALKEAKSTEARKDSETLQEDGEDHLTMRQISTTSNLSEVSSTSSIEEKLNQESNGKVLDIPLTSDLKKPTDVVHERPKSDLIEDTDEKSSEQDLSGLTGKLIKKEHREVGSVSWRVYVSYLTSCGPLCVALSLLLLVVNQALLVSTNIWVSHWASRSTMFVNNRPDNSTEGFDNSRYIQVYVTLSVCAVMVTLVAGFVFQFTGVLGAKNIHHDLLHRVMHVPMRFFDTNPSGRIINRFSSDLSQIDQKIPGTWEAFLRCTFSTFGAIIVNCIGTPFFIIAAVGTATLYFLLERLYIATARELQRLDSVTKSPVFSHFSETLSGLQTIRAYKAQSRFRQTAISSIDKNVLPFLFNQTANRWLGVRLDYFGAILVLVSAVATLSAGLAGKTDPAFVGLCIAYALMVSNYLNWIVRNSTELEMMMNAVERVDEYKKLDIETTPSAESSTASEWPSKGSIEFHDVSLRYDADQEPVVHSLSFKIQPGEKVGICGRTGSGKSSLTLSLFRMLEISEGEIIIDGRNICQVALPELRSKLAIIPQDPILFTGTIRYNLDPTSEIADSTLWTALESVQLKDTIEALPEKLDAHVSEGGENFSIGQKQLFCLVRAFLRENKILVLDEATASIDLETDNKLQKVIGTVFKDRTVITIAHRISTIMKYDRVMTMDHGRLKEFDTPARLLKDEDGLFARLVKHSYK